MDRIITFSEMLSRRGRQESVRQSRFLGSRRTPGTFSPKP